MHLRSFVSGIGTNATAVYTDPVTGKVTARFNGKVVELDIDELRYFQLVHGTDLSLPLEYRSVAGPKDVLDNPKANFMLFSATIEKNLQRLYETNWNTKVLGKVAELPANINFRVFGSKDTPFDFVKTSLAKERADHRYMAFNEAELKKQGEKHGDEIRKYKERHGIPATEEAFVIDTHDTQLNGFTKKWIQGIRAEQKSLVFAFLPDTDALNAMKNKLIKEGVAKAENISIIYSDAQYEKSIGNPKEVEERMNIAALDQGKAEVFLIDASYVIRGLDMNFKGDRAKYHEILDRLAFAGYRHFSMGFFGAQNLTEMQVIQGIGRLATRRILPGAAKDIMISADIQTAQVENAFLKLTNSPEFKELLGKMNAKSWNDLNDKVNQLPPQNQDRIKYEGMIASALREQWAEVSEQKLHSSGMIHETSSPQQRYPGMAVLMSGRQNH
jgi:hypothetical protein